MRTDLTFNSNTNKQSFGDFGVKELQQGDFLNELIRTVTPKSESCTFIAYLLTDTNRGEDKIEVTLSKGEHFNLPISDIEVVSGELIVFLQAEEKLSSAFIFEFDTKGRGGLRVHNLKRDTDIYILQGNEVVNISKNQQGVVSIDLDEGVYTAYLFTSNMELDNSITFNNPIGDPTALPELQLTKILNFGKFIFEGLSTFAIGSIAGEFEVWDTIPEVSFKSIDTPILPEGSSLERALSFKELKDSRSIEKWNTAFVENFAGMLEFARLTRDLDLRKWDLQSAEENTSFFAYGLKLNGKTLYLPELPTEPNLAFFFSLLQLEGGRIKNLHKLQGKEISDMEFTFYSLNAEGDFTQRNQIPKDFDISILNTSKVSSFFFCFVNTDWSLHRRFVNNWDVSSAETFRRMFFFTVLPSNFDISNWKPLSLTNGAEMFDFTVLPEGQLDKIYQKWSKLPLQQGVTISFGENTFSEKGLAGKAILQNEFNWNITDGGLE